MLDYLLRSDYAAFHLINGVWTSPFLDGLMPMLRNKYVWAPFYLFLISFFLFNYERKGILALLYLGITVLFCDQLSSDIIKPLVQRLRPCHDPLIKEQVHLLVSCGGPFSFPSSHAANHFGVAFFLGLLFFRRRFVFPIVLFWGLMVSYAQVYVGVHYPLDIAGGALLGALTGTVMLILCRRHLRNDFLF